MAFGLRSWVLGTTLALVSATSTLASAQTEAPAPPPAAPPAFPSSLAPAPLAPPPAVVAPVAPPPASGCTKDTDCKGERICSDGKCVAPNATPVTPNATPVTIEPLNARVVPVNEVPLPQRVIVVAPPPDRATRSGATVGLRFGVGFPGGSTAPGVATSTEVGFLLPVTLDVGYRLNPHWYVGGYLSIAYGTSASASCEPASDGNAASCYATDIRAGLDVQYRFLPDQAIQPWVGLGAGWEVLNKLSSDDDGGESEAQSGVEMGHVDVGLDFRAGERDKFGVYATSTFGDFFNGSSIHEWFMIGGRWRHDLDVFGR